ncbi:MAG: hypothetical protein ACRD0U_07615 [Acidimicrobiales bacterium]
MGAALVALVSIVTGILMLILWFTLLTRLIAGPEEAGAFGDFAGGVVLLLLVVTVVFFALLFWVLWLSLRALRRYLGTRPPAT